MKKLLCIAAFGVMLFGCFDYSPVNNNNPTPESVSAELGHEVTQAEWLQIWSDSEALQAQFTVEEWLAKFSN